MLLRSFAQQYSLVDTVQFGGKVATLLYFSFGAVMVIGQTLPGLRNNATTPNLYGLK